MTLKNPVIVSGRLMTTITLIRALGKRKIPIFQFHHQKRDFSTYSKYSKFIKCFDPLHKEKNLLNQLINFAKRFDRKIVLFPISDEYILFISKHSKELEKYFYFYKQSFDIEKLLDKRYLIEVCKKSGLPFPKSISSNNKNKVYHFFKDLKNPIIAKRASHYVDIGDNNFWKAVKLSSIKEIDNFFSKYKPQDFIFQEYIPGDDTALISYLPLVDKNKKIKMELVGRKIAQFPLKFGSATIAEQINDKDALDLGRQWIKYLGLRGPSQVEFIKDERDGLLKFLEINPRFIYWSNLMANIYDDIYYAAYRDLIGKEIKSTKFNNYNTYWIDFLDYFGSIILFERNPLTFLKKMILPFKKKRYMADIDFFDLKPVIYHIISSIKKLFQFNK